MAGLLVRNLAGKDPVCRLLMTMRGVGPVVALTFVSAIDDPDRFRRSKDVGPWAGLTPGRNQSGERDIVGAVTKAGDADLRTALYQAATVMLNCATPNWLKAWALRLAVLRGRKRASVALARRIIACRPADSARVSSLPTFPAPPLRRPRSLPTPAGSPSKPSNAWPRRDLDHHRLAETTSMDSSIRIRSPTTICVSLRRGPPSPFSVM